MDYRIEAEKFLREEQQFRLGFLTSEARNPLTFHLDSDFERSSSCGVNTLLSCDTALLDLVRKSFASENFLPQSKTASNATAGSLFPPAALPEESPSSLKAPGAVPSPGTDVSSR